MIDKENIIIETIDKESDTISRKIAKYKYKQKLINNLKDKIRDIDLSEYAEAPYKAFCEFIDSLPPATNPIGHWVKGDKTEYKCDVCGYGVMAWNTTPHCPNCGLKMEMYKEVKE